MLGRIIGGRRKLYNEEFFVNRNLRQIKLGGRHGQGMQHTRERRRMHIGLFGGKCRRKEATRKT
jgi:hypothetical protein